MDNDNLASSMTRKTAVRMQSEIYNIGKPCAAY